MVQYSYAQEKKKKKKQILVWADVLSSAVVLADAGKLCDCVSPKNRGSGSCFLHGFSWVLQSRIGLGGGLGVMLQATRL